MRGHTEIVVIPSRCLRGNPLGDPAVRRIPVYLPPSYAHRPGHRYPVIYYLPGFTGTGEACCNVGAWSESLPQRIDRLIRSSRMPEAICVMVDGFTAYGGSQYINSPATGRYMDYLVDDLIPWIDRHYRTIPRATARGCIGKSSGGFGALTVAMRRPGIFNAVASQSGDMYFDYVYGAAFPSTAALLHRYGGSLSSLLKAWRRLPNRLAGNMHDAVSVIAMASCYSPNPRARLGFDLPIDPATGTVIESVRRRWLAWDPVRVVGRYAAALRRLRWLYLEVGARDEYHLQFGHRLFVRELKRLRIRHHYEEFDDGHRNIQYRLDGILPRLANALGSS